MATLAGRWVAAAIFVTLSDRTARGHDTDGRGPRQTPAREAFSDARRRRIHRKTPAAVKDTALERLAQISWRRSRRRGVAARKSQLVRERLERGARPPPLAQRPDPLLEQAALGRRPGGEAHDLEDVGRHAQRLGAGPAASASSSASRTRISAARRATPSGVSPSGGSSRAAATTSRDTWGRWMLGQQRGQRRHDQHAARLVAQVGEREQPAADVHLEQPPAGRTKRLEWPASLGVAGAATGGARGPARPASPGARRPLAGKRDVKARRRRGWPGVDQRLERRAPDGVRGRHAVARHAPEDVGARARLAAVASPLRERVEHRRARAAVRPASRSRSSACAPMRITSEASSPAMSSKNQPQLAYMSSVARCSSSSSQRPRPRPLAARSPAPAGRARRAARSRTGTRLVDDVAVGVARPPRIPEQIAGRVLVERTPPRRARRRAPAAAGRARPDSTPRRRPCGSRSRAASARARGRSSRPSPRRPGPSARRASQVGGWRARKAARFVTSIPRRARLDVGRERQRQIGELLVVAPQLAVRGAQHQPLARRRAERSAEARTPSSRFSARLAASPNATARDSSPSKTASAIWRPEPSRCRQK